MPISPWQPSDALAPMTTAGSDETYVIMSLATIDPNNPNTPVQTQRTAVQDGVHRGDTIFKDAIRMRQRISGTSGILVHLAVWDEGESTVKGLDSR